MKSSSHDDVLDTLLRYVSRELLVALPFSGVLSTEIEAIVERGYTPILALGERSPTAIARAAAMGRFASTDDRRGEYEVGLLLVRVLDDVDPGGVLLTRLAMDKYAPSHVRCAAIDALAGRARAELTAPLVELVRNWVGPERVLNAALAATVAARHPEAIAMAHHLLIANADTRAGAVDVPLSALAGIGDPVALPRLIAEGYPPSRLMSRTRGALHTLVAQLGGPGGALDALGVEVGVEPIQTRLRRVITSGTHASLRRWAFSRLRQLARPSTVREVAIDSLGGSDWMLAWQASLTLEADDAPATRSALAAVWLDAGHPAEQRRWVYYTLVSMSGIETSDLHALPADVVPIPGQLPDDLREVIAVHVPVVALEPGSDVRWLIAARVVERNGALAGWPSEELIAQRASRLIDALTEASVPCGALIAFASTVSPDAVSNYHLLPIGSHTLRLSDIGPFVTAVGSLPGDEEALYRRAAVSAEWRWLDRELLGTTLVGLLDGTERGHAPTVEELLFDHWYVYGADLFRF